MSLRAPLVWGFAVLLGAVGGPTQAGRFRWSHHHGTTPGSSAESAASPSFDAYIDMGGSSYPDAATLTTGNAQPWYDSTQVAKFFGGAPSAQQRSNFTTAVFQDVEQTFRLSGVSVALTVDPSAHASHTLSLVSNTSSQPFPGAIGTTYIGGSGFSFIDPEAKAAQSLGQLEWIVAHNISHELMLAFGVGENYDQSGNYVDAKAAKWAMIVNPNSTFSPAAAQALNQAHLRQNPYNTGSPSNAQTLETLPEPIPEPHTLAIWGLGLMGTALGARVTRKVP